MNRYGVIYKITNKINGKIYIGQTRQAKPKNRIAEHFTKRVKNPSMLYLAAKKYGRNNFEWEIIASADSQDNLNYLEKYFITFYRSLTKEHGYNICIGGTDAATKEVIWTLDAVKADALKYKSVKEWQEYSPSSVQRAYSQGWAKEVTSHMVFTQNPANFWSYEKCLESALKYRNRTDWATSKGDGSAHNAAVRNGWLESCCTHMTYNKTKAGTWTEQSCLESALKYKTKQDWMKNEYGAYQMAQTNGWFTKCSKHMARPKKTTHRSDLRVRCIETDQIFISCKYASEEMGIHKSAISAVTRGVRPKAGGYTFEFVVPNSISKEDIEEQIIVLVNEENKNNPLSANNIAQALKVKGITVSESYVNGLLIKLGVPNMYDRKNNKAAA